MKKIFKKNQIIITALALMIAVAGYINYSDHVKRKNNASVKEAGNEVDNNDVDGNLSKPGATVLTSTGCSRFVTSARLKREQTRAMDKENYLEIINNGNLPEDTRNAAVAGMNVLTDNSEKELAAELLLEAKGFTNSVVSVCANAVDVVVESNGLTDTEKAQIEDIVTRKTNCDISQLTITTVEPENAEKPAESNTEEATSETVEENTQEQN